MKMRVTERYASAKDISKKGTVLKTINFKRPFVGKVSFIGKSTDDGLIFEINFDGVEYVD